MQDPQPALLHYLHLLRRHAWLIVATVVAALVVVSIYTVSKTSVYRASTGIVVGQGGGFFEPGFGGDVEPFTLTMSNLLRSNVVAEQVIQEQGLQTSPNALLDRLHVTTKPSSSVLEVSYDSTDKAEALRILGSVGTVFASLVEQKLNSQTTGPTGTPGATGPPITARVFDPPHLEPGRVAPRPARDLAFALALGLAIGLVLAFVRASLDDRIQSSRDAAEAFGAPVIGTLPKGSQGSPSMAAARGDNNRRTRRRVSALELLRANVQFSSAVQGPLIVVTSAREEEGKTSVAGDLGLALATAGNEVICVGADLHRPRLHEYLGRPRRGAGLVDVLEGRAELDEALQPVKLDGRRPAAPDQNGRLRLLGAGRVLRVSSSTLAGEPLRDLVEQLRGMAEYVIFDSPPALVAGDAYPLLGSADSVIVVARQGWTTKSTAQATRAMLEGVGAERVSVVLTNSGSDESDYGPDERTGSGGTRRVPSKAAIFGKFNSTQLQSRLRTLQSGMRRTFSEARPRGRSGADSQ
jgi:polysaccharide biosynthesis transport protein